MMEGVVMGLWGGMCGRELGRHPRRCNGWMIYCGSLTAVRVPKRD